MIPSINKATNVKLKIAIRVDHIFPGNVTDTNLKANVFKLDVMDHLTSCIVAL